jgi:hypothetical protein
VEREEIVVDAGREATVRSDSRKVAMDERVEETIIEMRDREAALKHKRIFVR